ncbi:MAG: redoxin domain-containing protein [Planctomycetes bacterium]|nr:redoxin domain-containing protein [Planctomycetota bacterium]
MGHHPVNPVEKILTPHKEIEKEIVAMVQGDWRSCFGAWFNKNPGYAVGIIIGLLGASLCVAEDAEGENSVLQVLARVQSHEFHPLVKGDGFTSDRTLMQHGVADLADNDWRVRLLAVRNLVRLGVDHTDKMAKELTNNDKNVRQVCAMALGILRAQAAIGSLEAVVRDDANAMVRSQAVVALGQIESTTSLELLRGRLKEDPSKDVRHQCELAIDQIQKKMGTTQEQLLAFQSLDDSLFETVEVGRAAPDFSLQDTENKAWRLSDFREKKWVVLIWVFADWCPVCHGEFHELMKMRAEFEKEGVQVFTVECHDRYRGRVMVGKELDPTYWFAKQSFQQAYTEKIWWPHLLDRAGAIGAMYGVDPMAMAVHAEYINRPSTVIVDRSGVVRLAYYGTYWGDRPTIEQTLDMIRTQQFEFEHPKRLSLPGAK